MQLHMLAFAPIILLLGVAAAMGGVTLLVNFRPGKAAARALPAPARESAMILTFPTPRVRAAPQIAVRVAQAAPSCPLERVERLR